MPAPTARWKGSLCIPERAHRQHLEPSAWGFPYPGMKTRFETSDYESEHPMRFRNDYFIGKYEITQEQWKAVMGTNPAYNQGDRNPVERVSWDVVLEFCAKLNAAGKAPDGWKFTKQER